MLRLLHRWFGLIAALLVICTAISGTALSVFPAAKTLTGPASANITVAELASRVQAAEPTVEQIRRNPSGQITAYYYEGDQPTAALVDPATGRPAGSADISEVERWLTNFHRSLFLDDTGRYLTAAGAAAMLVLCASGLFLFVRRAGGWRQFFKPVRGTGSGRLHALLGRFALFGLALSAITGLWMTAATFDLIPSGPGIPPFPDHVSGQSGVALSDIPMLKETSIDSLRSLSFPAQGDTTDVFTLKTAEGTGYIDQGTGETLAWQVNGWTDRVSHLATMLHTGQGIFWLGLLLGLSSLGVPIMSWTGLRLWLAGRRQNVTTGAPSETADTIILVGSEGGTTWGFANTLHTALTAEGFQVHVGAMNAFDPKAFPQAQRLVLMAATYGEGEAPESARSFLERFAKTTPRPGLSLAILGFGDRSFPDFCGYATRIAQVADENGWRSLVPLETINRQSPQDFARWGRDLAQALGCSLELNHQPEVPESWDLQLISRRDYGADTQAMTAILRFSLPKTTLWQRLTGHGFPHFEAGDLIGIVPEGSDLPRFYSLASGTRDGFVEICVRHQAGGLCSRQLTSLEPSATARGFIRTNKGFRPISGRKPVILIGAGTGIGPLAGFARNNRKHQPMYLYFGTRHPDTDTFFAEELETWQKDGNLTAVSTAFSRTQNPAYVQDLLRRDSGQVADLLKAGGQVLICGGRAMANGVASVLTEILAPTGLTLAQLKAEGRYAEDVY